MTWLNGESTVYPEYAKLIGGKRKTRKTRKSRRKSRKSRRR